MIRLALTLYTMAAPTFAGVGVVIALVSGYGTLAPILAAAGVGFIIAIPAAYLLAKQLYT
ncbi:CTP synthetase [Cognatishimia sp. MH4019]|uniref:CTP synthetase n=1 Tax=Cognatishimia sp. MH4019 TaxID=2854030 RepID=UPI001CD3AF7A|nr:CTP synthetase [Cognatishimia sp. MH4019]